MAAYLPEAGLYQRPREVRFQAANVRRWLQKAQMRAAASI
jgi:hypothetical protein